MFVVFNNTKTVASFLPLNIESVLRAFYALGMVFLLQIFTSYMANKLLQKTVLTGEADADGNLRNQLRQAML